jgi:hypothetical protein
MLRPFHRARGTLVIAAVLLPLLSIRLVAQTADSTRSTTGLRDSSAAGYGDSGKQEGVDTSRGVPGSDTSRATPPADTAPRPSADSAGPSLPQAGIPTDSILSVTCRSIRGGTVAPGLLLVMFRDSSAQKDRSVAVTRAGGAVVGEAPGGGQYVRLASDSISSRTLADQLVLDPAVASVSERTCPTGP